jgi:hypothetical protein
MTIINYMVYDIMDYARSKQFFPIPERTLIAVINAA